MQIHAVVPVKPLALAKSRLASALDPAARRALVLEMLGRVLATLRACVVPSSALELAVAGAPDEDRWGCAAPTGALSAVWVISSDPEVLATAANLGVRTLRERGSGLNEALEQARSALRAQGADALLVLPADVPLVSCADVYALANALAAGADVVIAPDTANTGTNALGLWLSADLAFQFGADSFARHRSAATWHGLIVDVQRSPSLGLDVDTPDSLARYRITEAAEAH